MHEGCQRKDRRLRIDCVENQKHDLFGDWASRSQAQQRKGCAGSDERRMGRAFESTFSI